jgi:hypothetical protein
VALKVRGRGRVEVRRSEDDVLGEEGVARRRDEPGDVVDPLRSLASEEIPSPASTSRS